MTSTSVSHRYHREWARSRIRPIATVRELLDRLKLPSQVSLWRSTARYSEVTAGTSRSAVAGTSSSHGGSRWLTLWKPKAHCGFAANSSARASSWAPAARTTSRTGGGADRLGTELTTVAMRRVDSVGGTGGSTY